MHSLTLKHVNARFSRVSHSVHKDLWQEFGHDDAHLGTNQLVAEDLGKHLGSFLTDFWVCGITVQVKQVYKSTC